MTRRASWAIVLWLCACTAPPPSGSPCSTDAGCVLGYYCSAASTCVRDCLIDDDCRGGSRCDTHGRCVSMPDAGSDASLPICTRDVDCSDGQYCDGIERCLPGSTHADARGCTAPAAPPCPTGQTCRESTQSCIACEGNADLDGDHVDSVACGGGDCDDSDADRFPGNAERCTADAWTHDEDCDPTTYGTHDVDADTHTDHRCGNDFGGVSAFGDDCDDMEFRAHPGLTENPCDGIDNDCDGLIDNAATPTYYLDRDGDGYGNAADGTVQTCTPPTGYVDHDGDCAPMNDAIHPGRPEKCDGYDDNCDGVGDSELEGLACGTMLPGRCSSGRTRCTASSPDPICDPGGSATTDPACTAGVSRTCSVCSITDARQVCNGCDFAACMLNSTIEPVGSYTPASSGISCWDCGTGSACSPWQERGPVASVPSGVYEIRYTGSGFMAGASTTPDNYIQAFVDGVQHGTLGQMGGAGLATGRITVTGAGCHSLEFALPCGGSVYSWTTARVGD